jgi:hypothetical protein
MNCRNRLRLDSCRPNRLHRHRADQLCLAAPIRFVSIAALIGFFHERLRPSVN